MPNATYSNQGLRVTVNDFVNDPKLIQARFSQMMSQQWVMETILRNEGPNNSGVIRYELEPSMFLDSDPELVAEGGEIPLTQGTDGKPASVFTTKYGLGLMITREMRTRNKVGTWDRRMNQARNTFMRWFEVRLHAMMSAKATQVQAVSTAWATTTTFRDDLSLAIQTIAEATSGQPNAYLGLSPDTLLIPAASEYDLLRNDAFAKLYELGDKTDLHPMYAHTLERTIMGLTVVKSRFLPAGTAYVMEAKTLGGWSDEYPLAITPMQEIPNRESWRSNITRRTGMFIDQPKAYVKLTGV